MSFSDFKDDKNRMDNWRQYLTKGVERLEEGIRDRARAAFDDLDAQMQDYDEDDEQPQRRQQKQQPQQPQQRQQKQQPQQRRQKQQKKQNVRIKSVNKTVSQANATPEQRKQIQKLAKKYLLAAYKKNPKGNTSMMKTRADHQARQQVLAPMQEGHDCAVHKRKGLTHKQWEKSQQEEVHVDPGNLNEFMRLIREEVEVVLSDAEAKEFFGEDAIQQQLKEEEKNNPWAICTSKVGREGKEKYEKCVKSVKKGQ